MNGATLVCSSADPLLEVFQADHSSHRSCSSHLHRNWRCRGSIRKEVISFLEQRWRDQAAAARIILYENNSIRGYFWWGTGEGNCSCYSPHCFLSHFYLNKRWGWSVLPMIASSLFNNRTRLTIVVWASSLVLYDPWLKVLNQNIVARGTSVVHKIYGHSWNSSHRTNQ